MLLVLPANVRLDWKVIARYKQSSLFGLTIRNEGRKSYNIDIMSKKSYYLEIFLEAPNFHIKGTLNVLD
jgi:hypothetical protein